MDNFRIQEKIEAGFHKLIHLSPVPISTTYFLYISGLKEGKRGLDPSGSISYHVDPHGTAQQTDPDRRTAK